MKAIRFSQLVVLAIVCAIPASGNAGLALFGDVDGYDAGPVVTFSGSAVAPVAGTFWNSMNSSGSIGVMTNADGTTASPITFGITGAHGGAVNFGVPVPASAGNLMTDWVYNYDPVNTNTFTFSNVPAGVYDLYLYGQSGGQNSRASFTFGYTQFALNAGATSFVLGDNYVKFTDLKPVGGVIAGTWVESLDFVQIAAFNGFQLITEVPEPSSVLLLGVSGALLVLRRRQ